MANLPPLPTHRCSRCGQRAGLKHACQRANIQPTRENLTTDMKSLLDQLHMVWDGEVEWAIICSPKTSRDAYVTGATMNPEKLRAALKAWQEKVGHSRDLGAVHHTTPQKAEDPSA